MSDYTFTDDMADISGGFGRDYEAACRRMVVEGLTWWDAHPDARPDITDADGAPLYVDTQWNVARVTARPLEKWLAGVRRSLPVPDLDDLGTRLLVLAVALRRFRAHGMWDFKGLDERLIASSLLGEEPVHPDALMTVLQKVGVPPADG